MFGMIRIPEPAVQSPGKFLDGALREISFGGRPCECREALLIGEVSA